MTTIRNKFHDIGNCHNKISMAAIVTKEALMRSRTQNLNAIELKELQDKTLNNLKKIEKFVIDADKAMEDLKPQVYKKLNVDEEI